MTKSAMPQEPAGGGPRCRWCRRPFNATVGPGRPRTYCSQRCRQWDWVSRQRSESLQLGDSEIVVSRAAVDDLRDRLYVLQCAIDDARHDIADPSPSASILRAALETVLVAADSVATAPWGHDVPDPA